MVHTGNHKQLNRIFSMSKQVGKTQKGFTIIEVVLVLAIAGLIFLIVFLAVPALQASRRDTQRKSDAGRFIAQLETYGSNNNGEYPASEAEFTELLNDYLDADTDGFNDPQTGAAYSLQGSEAAVNAAGEFFVDADARCDGNDLADGDGDRDIAIVMFVENGGTYCQDNGS
jgi:prepilin-type N-terminal cleavage/methylation domain-containing protein